MDAEHSAWYVPHRERNRVLELLLGVYEIAALHSRRQSTAPLSETSRSKRSRSIGRIAWRSPPARLVALVERAGSAPGSSCSMSIAAFKAAIFTGNKTS